MAPGSLATWRQDETKFCRPKTRRHIPNSWRLQHFWIANYSLYCGRLLFFGSLIIIGISFDIDLLPIAKSNLEHADWFVRRATESVLLVGGNPNFVTCPARPLFLVHLHDGAVVEDDPQLSAAAVRLQAQTLARQHVHQAHCATLVVRELFKPAPGPFHERNWRLFS